MREIAEGQPEQAVKPLDPQEGHGETLDGPVQTLSAQPTAAPRQHALGVLAPGDMLGAGLQIKALLGVGGMGRVYLARDFHLARHVAVKMVQLDASGKASQQERLKRFLTEARATAQLSHPNIVTVYNVGDHNGMPYLVMEEVRGEVLDDRIARGRVEVREALTIAIQIARALIHAHARGIIHRDLKPSNVIIQEDGVVKVLDFGLATMDVNRQTLQSAMQMEPDQLKALLGESPLAAGTMAYMAPEQWRGQPQDARTDLWALGMTLFEMLTGVLPFATAIDAVISEHTPSLSASGVEASETIDALLAHLLKRPIDQRPESAEAVLAELERLRAALDLPAPVVPLPSRPRPWLGLALGGAAALALVAGVAYLVGSQPTAQEPDAQAPAAQEPGGGEIEAAVADVGLAGDGAPIEGAAPDVGAPSIQAVEAAAPAEEGVDAGAPSRLAPASADRGRPGSPSGVKVGSGSKNPEDAAVEKKPEVKEDLDRELKEMLKP